MCLKALCQTERDHALAHHAFHSLLTTWRHSPARTRSLTSRRWWSRSPRQRSREAMNIPRRLVNTAYPCLRNKSDVSAFSLALRRNQTQQKRLISRCVLEFSCNLSRFAWRYFCMHLCVSFTCKPVWAGASLCRLLPAQEPEATPDCGGSAVPPIHHEI
jgi:hypothetical protein